MKQSIILAVQIILWTAFLSFDASAQLGFQNPFFVAAEIRAVASGGCATPNAPSGTSWSDGSPDGHITWTDPSGSFDGIEVWRSDNGAASAVLAGNIGPASQSYFDANTIDDGHVYIYKTRSTNACGTQSAFSNTVTNDIFVDVVYYNAFEQAAGSSKTATVDTAGFGSLTEQGGTVTSTTGVKNNASAFTSAAGHYLKSASASGNALFASDFTISIWVYVTSLPGSSSSITFRPSNGDILLSVDSVGTLSWSPAADSTATASLGALNTWHSVILYATAGEVGISVDGGTFSTNADGANLTSGDDFIDIAFGGVTVLDGRADEIGIFPRALSQAEATSISGGRFK